MQRYAPPTPASVRASLARYSHQRSGLLSGIGGKVGGAAGALGQAVSRPLFDALSQAQGGQGRTGGFQTPATRVGSSPAVRAAGLASRQVVQKPVQFYVGPNAAKMLVGQRGNPYAAGLEASIAMVPGASSKLGISRLGIAPSPRALLLARLARYAPHLNNMRS